MTKSEVQHAILQELGSALMDFPELRVGQLLYNAVMIAEGADVFNVTDGKLLFDLKAYRNRWRQT